MKYFFTALFTLIGSLTYAQDFYNMDSIQTIEVTFAESNWDALMDAQKAGDEDYIMAQSVNINGVTYDSVGVKYKGNSSYRANQVKNPWHIELDTYKEQEYDGYTDIKLANGYNDPSFLRDVLGYQIIRQYMDAPLANYANLYVNGTLIGLYSNTESVSKKFVKSRFGSKKNDYGLNLKAANNQFTAMDSRIATSEVVPTNYTYAGVLFGLLGLLVIGFLWARCNRQELLNSY